MHASASSRVISRERAAAVSLPPHVLLLSVPALSSLSSRFSFTSFFFSFLSTGPQQVLDAEPPVAVGVEGGESQLRGPLGAHGRLRSGGGGGEQKKAVEILFRRRGGFRRFRRFRARTGPRAPPPLLLFSSSSPSSSSDSTTIPPQVSHSVHPGGRARRPPPERCRGSGSAAEGQRPAKQPAERFAPPLSRHAPAAALGVTGALPLLLLFFFFSTSKPPGAEQR